VLCVSALVELNLDSLNRRDAEHAEKAQRVEFCLFPKVTQLKNGNEFERLSFARRSFGRVNQNLIQALISTGESKNPQFFPGNPFFLCLPL